MNKSSVCEMHFQYSTTHSVARITSMGYIAEHTTHSMARITGGGYVAEHTCQCKKRRRGGLSPYVPLSKSNLTSLLRV